MEKFNLFFFIDNFVKEEKYSFVKFSINSNSDEIVIKYFIIFVFIAFIIAFVPVLLYTAAFTLVERKVMGLLQRREGPDKVGIEGVGQPIADGVKLIKKETLSPKDTPSKIIFIFAPIISLTIGLVL